MARLCPPVVPCCVVCSAPLPSHTGTCPLRVFEVDHGFGGTYDNSEEDDA